jgi:hypothetical protein
MLLITISSNLLKLLTISDHQKEGLIYKILALFYVLLSYLIFFFFNVIIKQLIVFKVSFLNIFTFLGLVYI